MSWLKRLRDVRDGKFTPEYRTTQGLCRVVQTSGATPAQVGLARDWIERYNPNLCEDWWGGGDLWEGGRGQWRRRVAGELAAWAAVVLAPIGPREQAVYSKAADMMRAERFAYSCNAVRCAEGELGARAAGHVKSRCVKSRYIKWGTTLTGYRGEHWLHGGLGNNPFQVDEDDYRPLRVAMLQALADNDPVGAVRAYWKAEDDQ